MNFVFDLDGTLRDVEHRRVYVAGPKKNWRKFFQESVNDPPIPEVINIMKVLVKAGHSVQIWSGCSDEVWDETCAWLDKNVGVLHVPSAGGQIGQSYAKVPARVLLKNMRPQTDYQSDVELKRAWLNESIANGWKPDMVFDDRQCVVDMWREEGLVCSQVAPGDFDNKPMSLPTSKIPNLVFLIGPSGAGKSTYIKGNAFETEYFVVSSDKVRRWLYWDDYEDNINPSAYTTEGFFRTFNTVHSMLRAALENGVDCIYDAINLKRGKRMDTLKALGYTPEDIGKKVHVQYAILDRPIEEKLRDYRINTPWHTNEEIIERHHETFQSSQAHALKGDGIEAINVLDYRTTK